MWVSECKINSTLTVRRHTYETKFLAKYFENCWNKRKDFLKILLWIKNRNFYAVVEHYSYC